MPRSLFFLTFLITTSAYYSYAQQYLVTTIAGGAVTKTPVSGSAASFTAPKWTATDGAGNVYFASGNCIFRVDPAGTMTRFAGSTILAGFSGDGGPATNAQINSPQGLATDSAGNLYLSDTGNYRVRKVSKDGTIATVAGNGVYGTSGDNGPATAASLRYPSGLAVDSKGNLYISDFAESTIRMVSPDGKIARFAGDGTSGFKGDGGPATAAEFKYPQGLAADAAGKHLRCRYIQFANQKDRHKWNCHNGCGGWRVRQLG